MTATVVTVTEVQRAYLRDLADFEARGWQPCRHKDGRLRVLGTPTGVQLYVHRETTDGVTPDKETPRRTGAERYGVSGCRAVPGGGPAKTRRLACHCRERVVHGR